MILVWHPAPRRSRMRRNIVRSVLRSLAIGAALAVSFALAGCAGADDPPLTAGPVATATVNVPAPVVVQPTPTVVVQATPVVVPTPTVVRTVVAPAPVVYSTPTVVRTVVQEPTYVPPSTVVTATTGGRIEVSSPTTFAQAAVACLQRSGVLASTSGDRGCYVSAGLELLCTGDVDSSIPLACKREGNAAARPAMWQQ
ncbi:hypothetical protein COU18_03755 [Candidatus Kaiserbacteria bacterium CG10_big_fil_rev_8_21_14_0_10_51_14]|uniref:Uncharacterized protein n=1 Tax=Candidatus Kaiserbacteria bacterium CG10_big_fil_rev_8_21_14_0_10_51_14 TaxID=1974610 RepID=A0A2H0UBP3_9BACT|nr:MAG: hypothetical protein COU18_03755 [Candidatus Kaiserbacteria bacterium CG10_big_fil_rev_8_21_14_0_10_51_14]